MARARFWYYCMQCMRSGICNAGKVAELPRTASPCTFGAAVLPSAGTAPEGDGSEGVPSGENVTLTMLCSLLCQAPALILRRGCFNLF